MWKIHLDLSKLMIECKIGIHWMNTKKCPYSVLIKPSANHCYTVDLNLELIILPIHINEN